MSIRVLDPTNEAAPADIRAALRLPSLQGRRVGLISNGKEGTKGYFAHLERLLRDQWQAADVAVRVKRNYSAPAEAAILEEIKQWDAVVAGIGD